MKKVIKKNIKIILGFALGLIWSSGIAYAATILFDSEEVSYDNTTSGLSATNVQSALDELYVESTSYQLFESRVSSIENKLYPVGSIYLSLTDDTVAKVQNRMGGTWEKIGQGRTLIGEGINGTYTFTANSTGGSTVAGNSSSSSQTITNPLGEYTHKLNENELAKHRHLLNGFGVGFVPNGSYSGAWLNLSATATEYAGGDYYHNNIQPYLVVYMYKRTA